MCIDGQLFRICCAHFGEKTAGSPLASIVNSFRRHVANGRRGWRATLAQGIPSGIILSGAWCDDVIYVIKTQPHGLCGGERSFCVLCLFAKVEARAAQAFIRSESRILHLNLSDDKRQEAAQRVTYTGIVIDSVEGRVFCPDDKRAGIVAAITRLAAGGPRGAREVAAVRGKLIHYSACIPYIRAFAV